MSAFVISEQTMLRCVRAITARGHYGMHLRTFAGIATDAPEAATAIGRRLFTLNIEAVQQRYPDTQDNPANMPGSMGCAALPLTFNARRITARRVTPADLIDGIKALQALRYQCSEGDVPGAGLYAELGAAIGALAVEVVATLPEYQKASWD
jgi:hypothetical protein